MGAGEGGREGGRGGGREGESGGGREEGGKVRGKVGGRKEGREKEREGGRKRGRGREEGRIAYSAFRACHILEQGHRQAQHTTHKHRCSYRHTAFGSINWIVRPLLIHYAQQTSRQTKDSISKLGERWNVHQITTA